MLGADLDALPGTVIYLPTAPQFAERITKSRDPGHVRRDFIGSTK